MSINFPAIGESGLELSNFVSKVYGWMSLALVTSAFAAFIALSVPALLQIIFGNMLVFWGLLIVELLFVIALSSLINRMSFPAALLTFFVYSALNGLTLSIIFLIYTASSIALTFLITAGTFALMSIYGYITKRDLTSLGNLLFFALIGFIIATIVNMFLANPAFYWITTYIGILIFIGLTAYDTQRIKEMGRSGIMEDQANKMSILAALSLYLDFVNLFLLFLRLFGRKKE